MLRKIYWAYRNKISNKLFGVVHVPTSRKRRGSVLISFRTQPFTMAPWEHFTDPHTIYWESVEMVRLITERGYDVDIIEWDNTTFIPKKPYAVCIDIQKNLERLSSLLPKKCIKVMHVLSAYADFQNNAEEVRLEALNKRRGTKIQAHRTEASSQNPQYADVLVGLGNKTIHSSYAQFGKPIFPIHESVATTFPFPENKNFREARNHFLWMGGGGAVLKGVDLLIEAFAKMPNLHLHLVGPIQNEGDFIHEYEKEFSLPNIHLYNRPQIDTKGHISVNGKPLSDLADKCCALVYPSASEGTSGAVIQAMHAGLFPIITPESGIVERAPALIIYNPTVDSIKETVRLFSQEESADIEKYSRDAWSFVRNYYNKEEFTKSYSAFLDTILS